MIYDSLQKILGYKIPISYMVPYLCNFNEENVQSRDRYLVKILLIAGKKAITRKWEKGDSPAQDQWILIVEAIYTMQKLTHRLRLQEAQREKKNGKNGQYSGPRTATKTTGWTDD